MKQLLNIITDFFILDKEQLPVVDLYKRRILVMIIGFTWLTALIVLNLEKFGFYAEESNIPLFLFLSFCLLFLRYFGKNTWLGFAIFLGGLLITIYNVLETGYIYSYNQKWFVFLLLFVNFLLPRLVLPYLAFSLAAQVFFYWITPDSIVGIGGKEDYLIDNIAFIILSFFVLLFIKKVHLLQKSKIDDQNSQLLNQQNELIKSNQLLQNRSQELLLSNQELERFAYIASHDLKTPLNNIISFSQLLERELKEVDNEKAHEYFQFMKNGSIKMNNLIKDLLEYSRMPEREMRIEDIDLNELVNSITNSISEYLNERNAAVQMVDHLPTISANRTQMYLLFKNLIENGIKYNTSTHPKVEIKFLKREEYYQFKIIDNGIGIDPKYHDKIFQMFSRLHNDRDYEGTGLGLALSKKIVDGLKGKIALKSQLGQGSEFTIKLNKKLFKLEGVLQESP